MVERMPKRPLKGKKPEEDIRGTQKKKSENRCGGCESKTSKNSVAVAQTYKIVAAIAAHRKNFAAALSETKKILVSTVGATKHFSQLH